MSAPAGRGERLSSGRRRRADYGSSRFWERDRELLSFVSEQYAITTEQLASLIATGPRAAYNLRDRWRRLGWVESHQLIWRGPAFLWLTRNGTRIAESPYRTRRPDPGRAAHLRAVTDTRLLLEHELRLGAWECERSLARRLWERARPTCHLPDALLETARGRIAIEVELTLKGATRLELILDEVGRTYPEVWYFASPRVAPTLRRLAAESPWRNIVVHPYPPRAEHIAP
jgi:hypothetical protein